MLHRKKKAEMGSIKHINPYTRCRWPLIALQQRLHTKLQYDDKLGKTAKSEEALFLFFSSLKR